MLPPIVRYQGEATVLGENLGRVEVENALVSSASAKKTLFDLPRKPEWDRGAGPHRRKSDPHDVGTGIGRLGHDEGDPGRVGRHQVGVPKEK